MLQIKTHFISNFYNDAHWEMYISDKVFGSPRSCLRWFNFQTVWEGRDAGSWDVPGRVSAVGGAGEQHNGTGPVGSNSHQWWWPVSDTSNTCNHLCPILFIENLKYFVIQADLIAQSKYRMRYIMRPDSIYCCLLPGKCVLVMKFIHFFLF